MGFIEMMFVGFIGIVAIAVVLDSLFGGKV